MNCRYIQRERKRKDTEENLTGIKHKKAASVV